MEGVHGVLFQRKFFDASVFDYTGFAESLGFAFCFLVFPGGVDGRGLDLCFCSCLHTACTLADVLTSCPSVPTKMFPPIFFLGMSVLLCRWRRIGRIRSLVTAVAPESGSWESLQHFIATPLVTVHELSQVLHAPIGFMTH